MAPTSLKQLPTGDVTFLFTDIEGSTSLLVALGDRYQPLLERHAELLRGAFREHDGLEVGTEGDSFFVVFRSAPAALAAVADGQRAIASEAWPAGAQIRVRMGLHSGVGRLGGDNYAGLDVNRAARIASAAHGGQVVFSDQTHDLAEQALPPGSSLRDLGLHRLRDIPAPEHLWQLDIDGLATDFPALKTLDARPTNLPLDSTELVGREQELEIVRDLLEAKRIVTLTGPGGTGKTRLAVAVAASVLDAFGDGVFFVPLQDAEDRRTVVSEIAVSLRVREHPDRDLEESLASYLRDREVLLVLDNYEQVIDDAPIVSDLIAASPRLRIMVTSRQVLRVSGEQEYGVPPLRLPDTVGGALEVIAANESVRLFIDRANEVRPDFRLTDDNAAEIIGICRRLDGLPLAIELAAARVRLMSPEAILVRLERALPLLGGGDRDRPARQQTLRGAIDWSHELLEPEERELFARLAVFAGGWTLDAAEQVCLSAAGREPDIFSGLSSLVEKNLLKTDPDAAEGPRFGMLQIVREYAAERLSAGSDLVETSDRHAAWVAALVQRAEPEFERTDLYRWQRRVRREEDNIRAALRWVLDRGDVTTGLRIVGSLWRFWLYWGEAREGCEWIERVLALPGAEVPGAARARALSGLAGLRYWQGKADVAGDLYEEALALQRQFGGDADVAAALLDTYWASLQRRDMELAAQRADEALERFRLAGDEAGAAVTQARIQTASFAMRGSGSYQEAVAATQQAKEINQRLGIADDAPASLAYILWVAGEVEASHTALREALRVLDQEGHIGRMGAMFKIAAAVELALGRPRRAVCLAAAAARHADELGGELGGGFLQTGDPLEEARAQLTPQEHADAVAQGRGMSLDEVIVFALGDSD